MILYLLLLITATTVIASPVTKLTEEDARKFIKDSSDEFFEFFDTLSRSTFAEESNGDFYEVLQRLNLLENAAQNLTIMSKQAEKYPFESFKDEGVKLGMRNIRMAAYLYVLGDDYFKKLLISTKYLKDLGHDTDICNFRKTEECEMAYMPDIHKVISESNDEAELKYYWDAWREQNSKFGSDHLGIFIKLFHKAAELTGTKPLDLWYRIYMDLNFLTEMEKVMKELQPFYKKMHSYMRFELNKKYGDKIVPPNGPIPYHLYDKVFIQNWNKLHVIDPPYPEYHLPEFDEKIKNIVKETNKTLLDVADKFYESMGIIDVDSAFNAESDSEEDDHIKNLYDEKSGGNDCKADIYAQSTFYYLKTCPQVTFKKYLQTHGWAIPVYFVQQKKNLPYANFQSYNFEGPTGEAVILSASSPKHLIEMGLLPQESFNDKLLMNRLFKMSVHTMLNIPIFFVHSKVMNDLLSGDVKLDDVNEYYWKLMKEYVGVAPPMARTKESFDFPYTFYEDLENNYQTTKFVTEIAGYQIYSKLCAKSEIKQTPLHNCDFYNSKEVGKTLLEFMKLGSTKPWRQVLSTITGNESGLSGNAILEYYDPIITWLNEKIKDRNIPTGW